MKKSLKSVISMAVLLIASISVFAETVQLKITTSTGKFVYQDVDTESTFWGAFSGDSIDYEFASVEGLEKLPKLEIIEFQNLRYVKDYSFLSDAKNLKELYMTSCTVQSLSFLENLTKLQIAELNVYFDMSKTDAIEKTAIDLGKIKNLKELRFSGVIVSGANTICKFPAVPKFKNAKSVPLLDISNNDITFFTDEEVKLLNQYSEVIIKYNPVSDKADELAKLKKIYYTAE